MVTAAIRADRVADERVLVVEDVTISGTDDGHPVRMHGSIRADTGDLIIIQVADLHQAELWADVASGVRRPSSGQVSILGNDLATLDDETRAWLRGRIGRVFSRGNWLDRLSLLDNILLAARHHSERDEDDLKTKASALAAAFGLPGIPLGMPDGIDRIDLQRAACVRAFLGSPVLIILEDPTYAAHEVMLKPLVDVIRAARDRGAAVMWFSPSLEIWRDRTIPATRRYQVAANELMEVEGH